ncbi:MAG TPA: hypothetical protein VI278_15305 [Nitrososphaeraceae archaeon]
MTAPTITPTSMTAAKEATAHTFDIGVINPASQATDSSDSEEEENDHNQQQRQKQKRIYKQLIKAVGRAAFLATTKRRKSQSLQL